MPRTASAIALMCAGVVPQQPPTIFSQPFSAHSRNCGASDSGVSGKPVGNSGSGRPALGWRSHRSARCCASSSISGRISFGPSAQFMPTLNSGTWEIEFQNASTVCPVTPRLLPGLNERDRSHQRQRGYSLIEKLGDRKECRFGIERVENGFDQQQISAAIHQTARLLVIGRRPIRHKSRHGSRRY